MSNPSLILPQSPAYGEDYVYAAQVEDGAVPLYNVLPLTFTRASGGTRINKDGLVQNMPWNLIEQSNTFNTTWVSAGPGATITSGQTDPNAGSNAWLLSKLGATGRIQQTVNVGGVQTFFIYAKKNTSDYILINVFDGTTSHECWFNLSTGAVGTQNVSTGAIESVGNGWYKCSVTSTNLFASGIIQIYQSDGNGNVTGASGSIYIFNSQLNIGSTAQPYLATTDRLNMPRITYPVGGGCGALLLEKQSTNLQLWSQDVSNAVYVVGGGGGSSITKTANYGISPDGTQNATRLQIVRGSSYAEMYQRVGTTIGVTYTFSFYVKSLSGTSTLNTVWNGAYENEVTFTTEWVRYTYTFVAASTTSGINLVTFTGLPNTSTTADILVWGVQLEASSYATSYIPTTSSSATRVADVCSKTGISSLIGQTEGVIFADVNVNITGDASNFAGIAINDGTSSNVISFGYYQEGRIQAVSFVSGSLVVNINLPIFGLTSGSHKFALAYKLNDYVFYVDGVQVGSDTSASVPATSVFLLSDLVGADISYNQAVLFPTRLTNAELATLTTI